MPEKHGSHWLEREDVGAVTVVRLKTPKVLDEDTIREHARRAGLPADRVAAVRRLLDPAKLK